MEVLSNELQSWNYDQIHYEIEFTYKLLTFVWTPVPPNSKIKICEMQGNYRQGILFIHF